MKSRQQHSRTADETADLAFVFLEHGSFRLYALDADGMPFVRVCLLWPVTILYKRCVVSTRVASIAALVSVATMLAILLLYNAGPLIHKMYYFSRHCPPLHSRHNATRPVIVTGSERHWQNYTDDQIRQMSVLGRMLFLDEAPTVLLATASRQNFTILVWDAGPYLEERWIRWYTDVRHDPFEGCSVSNCRVTYDGGQVSDADAVLFHIHQLAGRHKMPKYRRPDQRWIFYTEESPYNPFLGSAEGYWRPVSHYNGVFNWSMHYRIDADVPVPYGRTLVGKDEESYASLTANKTKLVAILGSNCNVVKNNRWKYVKELARHVPMDMYGKCGTLQCDTLYSGRCDALRQYKFYLAFENSNCQEYVTEKVWWNAFSHGAVPVVMGATREQYRQILPPGSFLHVDDFDCPQQLAEYLVYLDQNPHVYALYTLWREYYRVVNEHGYAKTPSKHYCRVCEALNYNDVAAKEYVQLEDYWGPTKRCRQK